MTEDELRSFDENVTDVMRTIPGFLWSFHSLLCKEGFTESQALELTKEYLKSIVMPKDQ